jgi:hypothetical protein
LRLRLCDANDATRRTKDPIHKMMLPVAGFMTFDCEPDQYLVIYVLRPGNAAAVSWAIGTLRRLLELLRAVFPHT